VHRYSGSSTAYIHLHTDGKEVTLQVGDAGCGIRKGALKTDGHPVAVLGVGIQGMRERMRQLSGTLKIESAPNRGTVVIATLPIRERAELAPGTEAEGRPAGDSLTDEPRLAEETSARKRILIADDHEVLRRGVRIMLESEPEWEVCAEAVDGREAVEKTAELNPDLIILDINMPVLNGLAAVRQILQKRPNVKILIFTVHETDQTVRDIFAAGAHGYLSKAKAGQELIDVIKAMFAGEYVPPPQVALAAHRT
jgi:CheY-like chemotaxis protein